MAHQLRPVRAICWMTASISVEGAPVLGSAAKPWGEPCEWTTACRSMKGGFRTFQIGLYLFGKANRSKGAECVRCHVALLKIDPPLPMSRIILILFVEICRGFSCPPHQSPSEHHWLVDVGFAFPSRFLRTQFIQEVAKLSQEKSNESLGLHTKTSGGAMSIDPEELKQIDEFLNTLPKEMLQSDLNVLQKVVQVLTHSQRNKEIGQMEE